MSDAARNSAGSQPPERGVGGLRALFEKLRWLCGKVLHKACHNAVVDWVYQQRELIICAADCRALGDTEPSAGIHKNHSARLDEVASLVAGRAAPAARREMEASLAGGNDMFTCEIDGRVAGIGWSNPLADSAYFPYVGQRLGFASARVVALYSAFVSPEFRRQGVYRRLFLARARDAFESHAAQWILCAEEGGNRSARHAHDVLGMQVIGRFRLRRRFGRAQCQFLPEGNTLGLGVKQTGQQQWQLIVEAGDGEHPGS